MPTISIRAPYGLFIKILEVFVKYANSFRKFMNQSSASVNDARIHNFLFYRLSILSIEPLILPAYDRDCYTEQLDLAIIRFNIQAATFKFLRKPVSILLDEPHFVKCEIIDNLVCVFRHGQPAYFASYKFDKRWQLVEGQVHLSQEANVRLCCTSLFYFACSRLWIYDFDSDVNDTKTDLAQLKQIRFIERGHTELHSLSLEPLPKALRNLQHRAKKRKSKKVNCAR